MYSPPPILKAGDVFGSSTVIQLLPNEEKTWAPSCRVWECECICGKRINLITSSLRRGSPSACSFNCSHAQARRIRGEDTERLKARLLQYVAIDEKTACWNWTASLNRKGYGRLHFMGKGRTTHRLSYTAHRGPIPPGLCVCHKCGNPKCINPDHLFVGTRQENTHDMYRKGRAKPAGQPHKAKIF